eukprot:TRINITY_DN76291_c0_g1_i1.p1 TRINITY_DN76291_c0_g1~~TRINITY_DN76291_c0_g1_i1.p1  ORF type:complete len:306 (+),score=44.75 TRINITY_DN76291_c0_g1_i1:67-984(+)
MASAICSLHGKTRTVKNLTDDGAGGMRCLPGNECQVSGAVGAGGSRKRSAHDAWLTMLQSMIPMGGDPKRARVDAAFPLMNLQSLQVPGLGMNACDNVCSVHNKKRSEQSLVDDGAGGKRCAPGMTCQMGAGAPPGEASETYVCAIHAKRRSAKCLMLDPSGIICCAPGFECQVGEGVGQPAQGQPPETYMCAVHNKKRTAKCLIVDASGAMRCAPGFECQIGDGPKRAAVAEGVVPSGMTMIPTALLMQLTQDLVDQNDQPKTVEKGIGKGQRDWQAFSSSGMGLEPSCKWCAMGACWTHAGVK